MAEEKDFFVENHIEIGDFLAVGKKYIVYNEYESVCLFDKSANRYIDDIGDFYGDPIEKLLSGLSMVVKILRKSNGWKIVIS